MAVPAFALTLGKQILAKALYKKVTKELDKGYDKITKTTANDDNEVMEIVGTVEDAVLSKGKVSAWVSVVTAILYYASSQGYIDPALAELVNTILSNPEVVEGIEEVIE